MACAGMVLAWPSMDLAVAGWFYRSGEGFFANDWWPIQAVYKGAPWLLQLALAASASALIQQARTDGRRKAHSCKPKI